MAIYFLNVPNAFIQAFGQSGINPIQVTEIPSPDQQSTIIWYAKTEEDVMQFERMGVFFRKIILASESLILESPSVTALLLRQNDVEMYYPFVAVNITQVLAPEKHWYGAISYIDPENNEVQTPVDISKKGGKVKEVVLLKEVIRNVPIMRKGLKDTIVTWGWNNSGKSFLLTNLAVMLAKAGAKVALVEGNVRNRELFTFFEVENNHDGLVTLLRSNKDILDHAYSPIKNLYVFALLPFTELESNEFDLIAIQDKLRDSVDFIFIDSPCSIFENDFIENLKYVTKVLLAVTPNIAKLVSLGKNLESMNKQGVNLGKFDVILNQYLSSKEISPESIETILNQNLFSKEINSEEAKKLIRIVAEVPPIYPSAYESHIIGKPLTMSQKGDSLAKALDPVLHSLWSVEKSKKGLLSIFKRNNLD